MYNAEGIRTAKGNALINGVCSGITAQYLLGPGGEQVTELAGQPDNPVWAHTNVFGGGKLLATYDNAGTHFHFTDWLGTMRAQVNADGTVEETCLSLPFGDSLSCSGPGSDATEHHFTGKERDAESGLDYFGARYFQSNAGRWMSPDWAAKAEPIPYAKMGWPQSLNLYAYVGNNPLSMADADGHENGNLPEVPPAGVSVNDWIKQKDEHLETERRVANQRAQPPPAKQPNSGGGGFWHHVGNLLHGHAWNYTAPRPAETENVTTTETYKVGEPNDAVTAATDVAGLAGFASEKAGKIVGPVGAAVSIANDHSPRNIFTNLMGFLPEEAGGGSAVMGVFIDFFDYGAKHSKGTVEPKAWDNQELNMQLPTQDAGCLAAGADSPC